MKKFAQLYRAVDQTAKVNTKIKLLIEYFNHVEDVDKVWVIALCLERRPQRIINTKYLRKWSEETSGFPSWLFEGCYKIVGDLTETIALITPNPDSSSDRSISDWIEVILELKDKKDLVKKETIQNAWNALEQDERFLFNKLITGGFRIEVSQKTVIKALSKYSEIEEIKITHRLMGKWDPLTITFEELVLKANPSEDLSKPYPFCSAYALAVKIDELGDPSEWSAERKWDGIRGQLILRQDEYYLWTRGKELVSEKFPELEILKGLMDKDVVIDGEILPFKDGRIMNFNFLKTRMTRKNVTKKQILETPVVIIAYDLLEYDGEDWRDRPLKERRAKLEEVVISISSNRLLFSDNIDFDTWEDLELERAKSRNFHSVGIMLKNKQSTYKSGREMGDWWKWKIDPLTIDAVLLYVQRGTGQMAKTYTEFTFAVKNGEGLIPFTKASSGLSEEEVEEITLFVKKNTREKFGPVRSIEPELVFEIEFEGISKSSRHKSGVALRFPRIKRWRRDKVLEEINTLRDLNEILVAYEGGGEASTLF